MIYKVNSDFKGVLICKHFKNGLHANSRIDIEEHLFWEKDVIGLIRRGVLVPVETEIEEIKQIQSVSTEQKIKKNRDTDFKPVIWDFQKQQIENAQPIKYSSSINLPSENEVSNDNIESVEPVKIENKIEQDETMEDIKKKDKRPKKRNLNNQVGISPVGNVKPEPTQADAAIELDSRGNPIRSVADHLVDGRGFTDGEEIDFLNMGR